MMSNAPYRMRSARPFLPRSMILLMNRVTSSLLYRGSGSSGRSDDLVRVVACVALASVISRAAAHATDVRPVDHVRNLHFAKAHEKAVNALRRRAAFRRARSVPPERSTPNDGNPALSA